MEEAEEPTAVAGDGQQALGDHGGVEAARPEVGAGPVEGAVAQHDTLDGVVAERGGLEGGERPGEHADLPRGIGPEGVGLGARPGAGAIGEGDALGDDAARAGGTGGSDQWARDLAAQAARRVETALHRERVGRPGQVGQLVHDDLGLRRLHGAPHGVGVEGVTDRRNDPGETLGSDPRLTAGEHGDLVPGGDEGTHQWAPDCSGASRNEDAHAPEATPAQCRGDPLAGCRGERAQRLPRGASGVVPGPRRWPGTALVGRLRVDRGDRPAPAPAPTPLGRRGATAGAGLTGGAG